ncbi:MAG: hypothetical protein UV73_C0004G0141 [Candidatus Gottesmanbacteria bacterium GW2011_GWA2_43_14]|uniref:DUF3105 domain-containing protein n=1 Tax=Candidatus Gottesmanbacteria bacterium GW2011_GWA2_43_14 TaxID=1618443 RepID=A0A0G1DK01_9BACT|nr:MAG: hypothetical protein UV73_C0004G0141 [Candidatus Gottesmanbacteria bacterium GW2011_GWA2_43_14]
MKNRPDLPEGLPKKERRKIKRAFYREQMNKQLRLGKLQKYGIIIAACLVFLAGGYWFIREASKPKPGEFVPTLGNEHIQNITDTHESYNSLPPTSGTHVNNKAPWGVSGSPIPDELQLHNLEDGGIMVQYNCTPDGDSQKEATDSAEGQDECQKLVAGLTAVIKKYKDKVILAPYPQLDTKIALTAWTKLDKFNEFNEERIEKFIKAYRGIDHHRV